MKKYVPAPRTSNLEQYLDDELRQISAVTGVQKFLQLEELHVAPTKLFTGLVVLADGTDWDPGSGQGVYAYYGSAWNKLG